MKSKKIDINCDMCGDLLSRNDFVQKDYITLKVSQSNSMKLLMFGSGAHTYKKDFHFCNQCLNDLGTLVKELRVKTNTDKKVEE
jgi:hypothetical protein